MQPLIQSFTKNLKPCSGCGNGTGDSIYNTWLEAKQKGEIMKFQLTIVVEADTYKQAVNKVPDEFEILAGQVKPEKPQPTVGVSNVFSRTSGVQIPPQQ